MNVHETAYKTDKCLLEEVGELKGSLALHFWSYNYARVHESLRVTPAMEAGLARRICTWYDLLKWQEAKKAA